MENFVELFRLITFSIFTIYLLAIVGSFGILSSISESDYRLKKPFGYAFEIVIFLSGISIFLSGSILSNNIATYLMYIGGSFIFGVGIFPRFKRNKKQRIIHSICAGFGFLFTVLGILFVNWYIGISIVLLAIISKQFTKIEHHKTWNEEVVTSYSIFLSLELIRIFNL